LDLRGAAGIRSGLASRTAAQPAWVRPPPPWVAPAGQPGVLPLDCSPSGADTECSAFLRHPGLGAWRWRACGGIS